MKQSANAKSLYLSFFVIITCSLLSCVSSKKIDMLNKSIDQKNEILAKMLRTIDSIQKTRDAKLEANELDEKTNTKINVLIDSAKTIAQSEKENGLQKITTRIKKEKYLAAKNNIIVANSKNELLLGDLRMVNDLIATSSMEKFNIAAFFEPGVYELAVEVLPQAKKSFSPILEKINSFAAKYPNKDLETTIVILGYADEQNIKDSSTLYYKLANNLKEEHPTRQQLNLELSRLRTLTIAEFLKNLAKENTAAQKLGIQYIAQGRGETLPNPKIKDYAPDDERRRVVVLYWSVLPK